MRRKTVSSALGTLPYVSLVTGRKMRSNAIPTLLALGLCAAIPAVSCGSEFESCEFTQECGSQRAGGTSGDGGNGGAAGGAAGGAGCDAACGGTTSVCDSESAECIECLDGDDCDDGFCDPETHSCVECLEHSDCMSPSAGRCDGGECTPCTDSEHCAGISGKEACAESTGACVECTANDESGCGNNSCDPATNQCTETARGSRTVCRTCVADSECEPNYRCVPMEFQGEPREGGYCLKLGAMGCERPLTVPTPARTSLSGAEAEVYCGVSESRTTCEAILDLLADEGCTTPSDCGVPGLDDARCETVNLVLNRCTYSCDLSNQCPNTVNCGGPSEDKYCGAP